MTEAEAMHLQRMRRGLERVRGENDSLKRALKIQKAISLALLAVVATYLLSLLLGYAIDGEIAYQDNKMQQYWESVKTTDESR